MVSLEVFFIDMIVEVPNTQGTLTVHHCLYWCLQATLPSQQCQSTDGQNALLTDKGSISNEKRLGGGKAKKLKHSRNIWCLKY